MTQALHQATQGQVLASDGKTVRRSFDTATGQAALHGVSAWGLCMGSLHGVSAWATNSQLVLAPQAVGAGAAGGW